MTKPPIFNKFDVVNTLQSVKMSCYPNYIIFEIVLKRYGYVHLLDRMGRARYSQNKQRINYFTIRHIEGNNI